MNKNLSIPTRRFYLIPQKAKNHQQLQHFRTSSASIHLIQFNFISFMRRSTETPFPFPTIKENVFNDRVLSCGSNRLLAVYATRVYLIMRVHTYISQRLLSSDSRNWMDLSFSCGGCYKVLESDLPKRNTNKDHF